MVCVCVGGICVVVCTRGVGLGWVVWQSGRRRERGERSRGGERRASKREAKVGFACLRAFGKKKPAASQSSAGL